jgi:hypothetical protein
VLEIIALVSQQPSVCGNRWHVISTTGSTGTEGFRVCAAARRVGTARAAFACSS